MKLIVTAFRSIAQWFNCLYRLHPLRSTTRHSRNTPPEDTQGTHTSPDESASRLAPSDLRVIQEEITFNLAIKYNDDSLLRSSAIPLRWAQESMLDVMRRHADDALHGVLPQSTHLQPTSGKCNFVIRSGNQIIKTVVWESDAQWREELPLAVAKIFVDHVRVPFFLDICWEYAGPLPIQENERYSETVHKAIVKKSTHNWESKIYISQSKLSSILSKDTVALLVKEDESLSKWPPHTTTDIIHERRCLLERSRFIEDIWSDAIRLLALHVCSDLPLICLFEMMARGLQDRDLLRAPLTQQDCPCERYAHLFNRLVQMQENYFAHKFVLDGDGLPPHDQLHPRIVIPIKKSGAMLGRGGFGDVWKVFVEPGHHSFPCEDNCNFFAMKVFHNDGQKTATNFDRESDVLHKLAKLPHPHVMPHLASWTQNGKFYMLFPLATSNLRQFWTQHPPYELEKAFILWLIQQLLGLANGVRNIHNLGPAGLGPTIPDHLREPGSGKGQTGFHHDLKPENILVFDGPNPLYPTLKIADFGSAKVSQMLSGSNFASNHSYKTPAMCPGDPMYGAPETENEGSSRPYDIWSLGCIYLEILLWVLNGKGDIDAFKKERRLNSRQRTQESQNEAFWYKPTNGPPVLKDSVNNRLILLQKEYYGRGIFELFVQLIRRMLVVDPQRRITAAEASNALDAMRMQAELELRDKPNAYLGQEEHNAFAAPPTKAMEDVSSIGDREGGSPSFSLVLPSPTRHHRATSDGMITSESRLTLPGSSSSDQKYLFPLETRGLPSSDQGSHSPTISITGPEGTEGAPENMSAVQDYEKPPLFGAHTDTWRRQPFRNARPGSIRSQRSMSDGGLPTRSVNSLL